jgi:hypothetical protein
MTREEALKELIELKDLGDEDIAHQRADQILMLLIDDEEIWDAFIAIPKWYA